MHIRTDWTRAEVAALLTLKSMTSPIRARAAVAG